jgi:hypothetical protein
MSFGAVVFQRPLADADAHDGGDRRRGMLGGAMRIAKTLVIAGLLVTFAIAVLGLAACGSAPAPGTIAPAAAATPAPDAFDATADATTLITQEQIVLDHCVSNFSTLKRILRQENAAVNHFSNQYALLDDMSPVASEFQTLRESYDAMNGGQAAGGNVAQLERDWVKTANLERIAALALLDVADGSATNAEVRRGGTALGKAAIYIQAVRADIIVLQSY